MLDLICTVPILYSSLTAGEDLNDPTDLSVDDLSYIHTCETLASSQNRVAIGGVLPHGIVNRKEWLLHKIPLQRIHILWHLGLNGSEAWDAKSDETKSPTSLSVLLQELVAVRDL